MANFENFDRTSDKLQDSKPSLAADLGQTDLALAKQANQQQTDGLVGKGVLPSVDLYTKQGDAKTAAPTRVAEVGKESNPSRTSDACERTIKAVDKGIDASKLSAEDKQVAKFIVAAIAKGDTAKLQSMVDAMENKGDKGHQRMEKIVKTLNKAIDNGGIRDLELEYPIRNGKETAWELQVSGDAKAGQSYVTFKPGERPITSLSFGTHDEFDTSDLADANRQQEARSAKTLREITQNGQALLEQKEKAAVARREAELQRELNQIVREWQRQ